MGTNDSLHVKFYKSYFDGLEGLTVKMQNDMIGSAIRFFFTGESQADRFKVPYWNVYKQLEDRILLSKMRAEAGAEGGKQKAKQTSSKPLANSKQKASTPPSDKRKRKRERKEREIVDDDVLQTPMLEGPDEIAYEPGEFAHFMAEGMRLYNEATGQNWMAASAAVRQGMLDAFRAGRTLDDVKRVVAEVATWEPRYQTLDAVWSDGKFEKHLNRLDANGGGEHRDYSQYNHLITRVV